MRTRVTEALGSSPSNEPVVLGPNTVIDLPEGASLQFVEIQARSLAEHRAWLESLGDDVAACSADRNAAERFTPEAPVDIEIAIQAEGLGDIQPLRERHQGEIGEVINCAAV